MTIPSTNLLRSQEVELNGSADTNGFSSTWYKGFDTDGQMRSTAMVTQPAASMGYPYAMQAPPQVIYVQAPNSGAKTSALMMFLSVLLLSIVAIVAGYFITRAVSPSTFETESAVGTSMRQGFSAGKSQGVAAGRTDALQAGQSIASLRAQAVRESAFSKAYNRGFDAGKKAYRSPARYYGGGYRRGYSSPRYSYGNNSGYEMWSALGTAQSIADATGASTVVEYY